LGYPETIRIDAYTKQDYLLSYTENGTNSGQIIGFSTKLVNAVLEETKIFSIGAVRDSAIYNYFNNKEFKIFL